MDYNRCGVPLLEIVSEPELRNSAEALAYLRKLREVLLYLGVSDCKMQEGSLRADVNLSTRSTGDKTGVRTEMKNLNSFKAIDRAIEYESSRQIDIRKRGGEIRQETLRWDDNKGISYGMRSKENAQDYRYFPEPDLLPIEISDTWLTDIRRSLPELAHTKRERYIHSFGLSEYVASVLTAHKNISDLFETVSVESGEPIETAHLLTGEIMRLLNQTNTLPEELSLDGHKLSYLITLVLNGKINRSAYKNTIEAVFTCNCDPEAYIIKNRLLIQNDGNLIAVAVDTVLMENPGAVSKYREGQEKVFGFLMGEVMKKLGSAGNPDTVRTALKKALS